MRAAVGVLLGLAFNVVFIAALIALFKPLPKLKMPTRKHALYGLGLSFVLLVLWVIVMPAEAVDTKAQTAAETRPLKADQVATEAEDEAVRRSLEPSLPVDAEEFADAFNASAKKLDKPWRISGLKIADKAKSYMVSDHLGFIFTKAADGNLASVMVIATGDGTFSSGADALIVMSMAYCAAAAIADTKQCGGPVFKLLGDFKEGGDAQKAIHNNIQLSYSRNELTGNLLTITPLG